MSETHSPKDQPEILNYNAKNVKFMLCLCVVTASLSANKSNCPKASCVHVFIPKTAAAFDYATKRGRVSSSPSGHYIKWFAVTTAQHLAVAGMVTALIKAEMVFTVACLTVSLLCETKFGVDEQDIHSTDGCGL